MIESCLQDSPPAAGRLNDIFISAAVRSPRSVLNAEEGTASALKNAPLTQAGHFLYRCQ